jgi:hypothetical protein
VRKFLREGETKERKRRRRRRRKRRGRNQQFECINRIHDSPVSCCQSLPPLLRKRGEKWRY